MPLKEVDWDSFEFRCHYFGELMTPTRGKSNIDKYNEAKDLYDSFMSKLMTSGKNPTEAQFLRMNKLEKEMEAAKLIKDVPNLSGTAKRRLAQIYTEETTGRKKDIQGMQLEKGLLTEEESITAYSKATNTFYKKNKERLSNGYINGEIDFDDEEEDMIIDAKSTWDIFTFDSKMNGMSFINEWQGHCYMWLKNRKKFRIAFVLNNTPDELIKRMIKSLEYNFIGSAEELEQAKAELIDRHTYNDLPDERKIRLFDLQRDESKIEAAKLAIPYFRNYLKNFDKKPENYDFED